MKTQDHKKAARSVLADKRVYHRDGSVTFKRAYFYRMGGNAPAYAERCARQMTDAMGERWIVAEAEDAWAAWPKTSYFVATVRRLNT